MIEMSIIIIKPKKLNLLSKIKKLIAEDINKYFACCPNGSLPDHTCSLHLFAYTYI